MIRDGTLVRVVRGHWAGRIGLVEAADPVGIAVRLRGPTGAERDPVVVDLRHVVVIDLRTTARAIVGVSA